MSNTDQLTMAPAEWLAQRRIAARTRIEASYEEGPLRDRELDWLDGREHDWLTIAPHRYASARLDDYLDAPSFDALCEFVRTPSGRNLVLVGPVGTGKTHGALAVAREHFIHNRRTSVAFWPVVELLDAMRPHAADEQDDLFDKLTKVDYLVLDDIGVEKASDWTTERLYAIVNNRYNHRRPIIATANMQDAETFESTVGARLFSRLVNDETIKVRLAGDDRRRNASQATA